MDYLKNAGINYRSNQHDALLSKTQLGVTYNRPNDSHIIMNPHM